MKLAAIILAAGQSSRFNNKIPKQFHYIDDDLMINHSIKKLSSINHIKEIYIALNYNKSKNYLHLLKKGKNIKLFEGGKYRSQSVLNGLKKINKKFTHVLIHDAARPYFSKKLILKMIKNLKKYNCVIPAVKSSDTTIYKNLYLNRDKLKLLQTPQGFNTNKIFEYHKKNKNKLITDDSVLFYNFKEKIKFIKGEEKNKKITYTTDINKKEIYGIGYDIHQMSKGYKLYVGGIEIPSDVGSVGHSDGDSLIHALIDSFLGAAKIGDIGTLFPNNKKYKDIRSTILLKKVIDQLKKINLSVEKIDLNIILQKPNLSNYKKLIKKNIAKLCDVDLKNINIKAKTTDRLGIIGKSKALACEVISTLKYDRKV